MRSFLVAAALILSACGPARLVPDPGVPAVSEEPAVRASVEGFLDAFAGRAPLDRSVTGPVLEDWARWVDRHGPAGERLRAGEVEVAGIDVFRVSGDTAEVRVEARVTSTQHLPGGKVVRVPRTFVGPMLLARDAGASHGWAVTDLVRDGRPMSLAINLFDDASGASADAEVEVTSLYRFDSGTFANLRVTNLGSDPLVVDLPHSLVQADGRFIGATAASEALADPIPPGGSVEGAFDFHAIPLRWLPQKVVLRFGGDAAVTVDLPTARFLPPEQPVIEA